MESKTLQKLTELENSLLFLHVRELKEIARKLSLIDQGNKKRIIFRICHFLLTGEKLTIPKYPKESCAQRGKTYPVTQDGLMIKGGYKNDLKNRLFFKHLIGPHFHFTAFGIDWLNEQWLKGTPPTYLEFAKMWENEYARRKEISVSPKEEWAYINFVQNFLKQHPSASQENINQSWQAEREKHKAKVYELLKIISEIS
ncbi:MAG: hypothetical protein Tsb0021_18010 [Chlamydiales bacterium]